MSKDSDTNRLFGIGAVPCVLALFIGSVLYRILVGSGPGFVGGSIVGLVSIFVFGIPIRMLFDKIKSGNQVGND